MGRRGHSRCPRLCILAWRIPSVKRAKTPQEPVNTTQLPGWSDPPLPAQPAGTRAHFAAWRWRKCRRSRRQSCAAPGPSAPSFGSYSPARAGQFVAPPVAIGLRCTHGVSLGSIHEVSGSAVPKAQLRKPAFQPGGYHVQKSMLGGLILRSPLDDAS